MLYIDSNNHLPKGGYIEGPVHTATIKKFAVTTTFQKVATLKGFSLAEPLRARVVTTTFQKVATLKEKGRGKGDIPKKVTTTFQKVATLKALDEFKQVIGNL